MVGCIPHATPYDMYYVMFIGISYGDMSLSQYLVCLFKHRKETPKPEGLN